jgi:hypothetical protein
VDAGAGGGDGSVHAGGCTTSRTVDMGVFLLLWQRWICGVICRVCKHVGLIDVDIFAVTLGDGALTNLCGGIPSNLGGAAIASCCWGLL